MYLCLLNKIMSFSVSGWKIIFERQTIVWNCKSRYFLYKDQANEMRMFLLKEKSLQILCNWKVQAISLMLFFFFFFPLVQESEPIAFALTYTHSSFLCFILRQGLTSSPRQDWYLWPPALASQSAWITGMCHHAKLNAFESSGRNIF